MARYRLGVSTGPEWGGGTLGGVTLTLVGTAGVAPPCHLGWPQHRLSAGSTVWLDVVSPQPLGTLLSLRLHKEPLLSLVPDRWFCATVVVTGPHPGDTRGDSEGDSEDVPKATFPCHRWVESGDMELREGTARLPSDAARVPELLRQRQEERRERREAFEWAPYAPGWPWRLRALPPSLCPWPAPRAEMTSLPGDATTPLPAPPLKQPLPESPEMTSQEATPLQEGKTSQEEKTSQEDKTSHKEMTSHDEMMSRGEVTSHEEMTSPLSPSLSFPLVHRAQLAARAAAAQIRIRLRGLRSGSSWSSFDDVRAALEGPGTPISEYVVQHWQEDAFFGEQFLSGVNPVLLRRCPRLPPNFPLTAPMVVPSLGPDTSLEKEMEAGRVFLADYALLEGLPTNVIEGRPQFVAAPLCLLWLNPSGQLLPVAIQLSQHPGPSSPIFLPGSQGWALAKLWLSQHPGPSSPIFLPGSQGWALAKLWVRGSHFILHEMVTHLLHGHFLAEAFAVATQRLPAAHPVHQLLLPHLRFTFHINILARETLLNPGGIIDQATSIGREGTLALVARGVAALTMAELCVPEDIRERGVGDIPGYHYRDDATAIWEAIDSYVQAIVSLFYPGDAAVAEDEELQDWVGEIFRYGVLGNQGSGFPSRLGSRPELVRFLTMIIFCCSARHAAVNSGQYDYAAWMPNTPGSLQRPPPAAPEEATEELLVATMPGPAATGALLALLSVVSYEGGEPRPLGRRSQDLLLSAPALRALGRFRSRLAAVSERIRARNARLGLPYPYLDPAGVQESISI
ncbi:polyunsaturated fatty acid lipoxygenase ALOX15B-like [Catharus ustulatus]|uniref:polyunsaturated fatty acid lipoxygenase ALOX15B-like n=1 Tax=Catharus ustulatus TaxID=91951 RepID=UPI00140C8853|nr:polyunsaturated fatty acid lipoxygenase ALOX15B-like [Catharus ustulatus]